MQMDFRVYQLLYANDLTDHGQELFDYLRGLSKMPGEHGFEYCITNEIDFSENIISFCFSEEHESNVTSVDDEKNSFSPDVSPYLNTFYAIDLQEKRMLVHHRDYPPNNLDRDKNLVRVGIILEQAFQDIYHSAFNYVKTTVDVTDDQFIEVFENNRITLLRVKLFNTGRRIIDGTQIFEENYLNNYWIQGFEADESDTYEVTLKAPGKTGEGDLRNSPIARSLINMVTKEIIELNYWTDEEGSHSNIMSRTDLKKFRIRGINKDTPSITAINTISNEVYRRRPEIRRYRAINDLE